MQAVIPNRVVLLLMRSKALIRGLALGVAYLKRGIALPLFVAALLLGLVAMRPAPASALPLIQTNGPDLSANGSRWIGYGGTFGAAGPYAPYDGFNDQWAQAFNAAQDLGFNQLRVYLPLFYYVQRDSKGKLATINAHLDNLDTILQMAENRGLHLDLTGDLVWHGADEAPDWYDAMGYADRWSVQQFFWRKVSKVAEPSNAVFMYELTSEPIIGGSSWYGCYFGGWYFCQNLATNVSGSTAASLAREWTAKMVNAVHSNDTRHIISIGMKPVESGPLSPQNVGKYLDAITFHEYPQRDQADSAISIAQWFASWKKPTILGETSFLYAGVDTQREFLLGIRPYIDSYITIWDGLLALGGNRSI